MIAAKPWAIFGEYVDPILADMTESEWEWAEACDIAATIEVGPGIHASPLLAKGKTFCIADRLRSQAKARKRIWEAGKPAREKAERLANLERYAALVAEEVELGEFWQGELCIHPDADFDGLAKAIKAQAA